MSECLTVREFDRIIFSETPKANYKNIKNKKDFDNLITFIHEFESNEKGTDVLEFLSIKHNREVGQYIAVKNYVGIIEMKNGFQIEILPKITFGISEQDKTKFVFLKMLRCLKEFNSKLFNYANMNIDKFNLYEIFINMYLNEVSNLLKKGIKLGYVNVEDNLTKYKGKLIIKDHLKKNLVHKEKFYVSYDLFNSNCAENKLIKSTLLKLKNISTQNKNKREILLILNAFNEVNASTNYDLDFSKIKTNRSKEYDILMIWSKIFLCNKSFTTFSGSTTSRALLFPMEKVFESYVAQKLKDELVMKSWNISTQDRKYYLFDRPAKFSLRPDIVIRKPLENNSTIVLDTKWKILNKSENYGISQDDMYQMYVYSKKYKAEIIWVLYPWNEESPTAKNSKISFIADNDDNVTVNVYFIDVANVEESLKELSRQL